MDDEERAQMLIDLYKQQMEHFHHTQDIEWKANFGLWTLLAGAIYLAKERFSHLSPCLAWIGLALIVIFHGAWLYKVHKSEEADKNLWCHYRAEQ